MKNFLIFLIIFLIPFSYYSFYDLRVITLLPFIIIFLFLYNKSYKINISIDFRISIILLFIVIVYISITKDFYYIIPIFLFFCIAYWFVFLGKDNINKLDLNILIKLYIYSVLIFSVVLLIQAILYFNGYTFGKVELFANDRFAFYVIWTDSSFVSLYIASVIPLVFYTFRGIKSWMLTIVFLSALIASSARTGIVALIVIILLNISFVLLKTIIKLKIRLKDIIYITIFFLSIFITIFLIINLGIERFSEGDNGRILTYLDSLYILADNPFFGTFFSSTNTIGAHNFLIHTLASGGFVFFVPFCFWLCIILIKTIKVDIYIRNSVLICFVGLNFVPSFFSAYFFSFLLSIMLIDYNKINK